MPRSTDRRSRRNGDRQAHPPYPRTARINSQLAQVLAAAVERAADDDERMALLTVTGVVTDPDLRHATVYFASLSEEASAALEERRVGLQAAIGRQVRMKRTPQLRFLADPAVAAGTAVEDVLRRLRRDDG